MNADMQHCLVGGGSKSFVLKQLVILCGVVADNQTTLIIEIENKDIRI